MKECSDSLSFVLGGKHRPPATPKKKNVRSGVKKGCAVGRRHPAIDRGMWDSEGKGEREGFTGKE